MTLEELIESEKAAIQMMRALGNRHPNDVETQRIVAMFALDAAGILDALHELLMYRDDSNKETEVKPSPPE